MGFSNVLWSQLFLTCTETSQSSIVHWRMRLNNVLTGRIVQLDTSNEKCCNYLHCILHTCISRVYIPPVTSKILGSMINITNYELNIIIATSIHISELTQMYTRMIWTSHKTTATPILTSWFKQYFIHEITFKLNSLYMYIQLNKIGHQAVKLISEALSYFL